MTMMNTYDIAGISLKFNYNFNKFFKNSIEQYQSRKIKSPSYEMYVSIQNLIDEPALPYSYSHKNKTVYETTLEKIIIIKGSDDSIKERIKHSYDFKHVDIQLSSTLSDRLPEQEYTLSGLFFMAMALSENKLSLHASAIDFNDRALLFSGVSGTGKTTHVKNWMHAFGDHPIINDDKPLISESAGSFTVHGTPFSGKTSTNVNESVPLAAIIFLSQSKENRIEKPSRKDALTLLLQNIYRTDQESLMDKALSLCESLISKIPVYIFHATRDVSSAKYIHNHLTKEGIL
jgi:hypothetical protein